MPPSRTFRVLQAHSDRVSLRQLAWIALACASLGVAVSGITERYLGRRDTPRSRAMAAARQHAREPEPVLQASMAPGPVLAAAAASLLAAPALAPEPEHVAAPQPATARGRGRRERVRALRLEHDRVTYLRCAAHAGREGCKRARALEQSVWRALRSLAVCYANQPPGAAEIRLDLRRERAPEIAYAAPDRGPGLNLRAVRRCVDTPLKQGLTGLARDQMLVSFRFGLR